MRFIGSLDGDNIYRERFAWGGAELWVLQPASISEQNMLMAAQQTRVRFMIGSGKDGSDNFAHEDNEGCSRAPPQTRKEAKR